MSAPNPFVNRPSWDEVMEPLGQSTLWPHIRRLAGDLLVARYHEAGDFDSGISGSDINHTIFAVASWVERTETYPADVLARLVNEVAGYG